MTYSITLYNKWKRPYYYVDNIDNVCLNTEYSSYDTDSKELCKQIIKDWLDVPETELTLDEVKAQFNDPYYGGISEKKLASIQHYYNGRLALYNKIMHELSCLARDADACLRYDIPYSCNHFTVEDELENEEQLEAYIEVKAKP